MSTKSLRAATKTEVGRLATIEHSVTRAKEAQRLQAIAQELSFECAEVIRACVRDMRELYGHSWADVADELGISRARAQQIGNA